MIVYVNTQGSRIIKEGRHLLVRRADAVHHTLFTYKLDQLLLFGNIEVTRRAMVQLMTNGVDTVFLTQNGRYLGRLAQGESKNVHLRKRQFDLLDDPDFALGVARSIVAGKLHNMANLLMRIKRARKAQVPGKNAAGIQRIAPRLAEATDVDTVRGYEGHGSALFFEGFRHGFIENQGFTRRVRRPPTDPVNSVLSLLYTFLMNRVYSAVRAAGLDPYPGSLHTLDYGRYSLVLDLMEEFRTIIVDTLVLSLFNMKILDRDDFIIEQPVPPQDMHEQETVMPDVRRDPIGCMGIGDSDGECFDLPEQRMTENPVETGPATGKLPVKLKQDAFKRVIDAFERKIGTPFYHPLAERQMTYQPVEKRDLRRRASFLVSAAYHKYALFLEIRAPCISSFLNRLPISSFSTRCYAGAMEFQARHYRGVVEKEAATYQPLLLK